MDLKEVLQRLSRSPGRHREQGLSQCTAGLIATRLEDYIKHGNIMNNHDPLKWYSIPKSWMVCFLFCLCKPVVVLDHIELIIPSTKGVF